jgi:hypothetical protein
VSLVLQIIGALAVVTVAFWVGVVAGLWAAMSSALEPDAADNLNAHRRGHIGDLERHRNN